VDVSGAYTGSFTSTTTIAILKTAGYDLTAAAAPDPGNVFESFQLNADQAVRYTPWDVTVANEDTIKTVFAATETSLYYDVTVECMGAGTGTVTVAGKGFKQTTTADRTFAIPKSAGYSLDFTAAADSGSVFKEFAKKGGKPLVGSPKTITVADGDIVIAVFSVSTDNTVTIDVDGNGSVEISDGAGTVYGTVTGPGTGTVSVPSSVTSITITAIDGSDEFEMFVIDGTDMLANPAVDHPITGDMTIKAAFIEVTGDYVPDDKNKSRSWLIWTLSFFAMTLSFLLIGMMFFVGDDEEEEEEEEEEGP